ncbi:MAG: YkvA family protein, partial [Dokdonella sp.]
DSDEIDILDSAKQALDSMCTDSVPTYVRQRLVHVQRLLMMFEDDEWSLPDPERSEALAALAYFGDPDDLIPDRLEVIGLIDDAVMLELLARRLRHVLDAYAAFCSYRSTLGSPVVENGARLRRSKSLAEHRHGLVVAMQNRTQRRRSRLAEASAPAGFTHRADAPPSH